MNDVPNAKPSRAKGCVMWVLGLVVFGAVVSHFQPKQSVQPKDEVQLAMEAANNRDNATLYAAKAAITRSMKDPRSAEFNNSFGWQKHGERVACGYVNAKNSFGAYAGNTQWLVRLDKGITLVRSYENGGQFVSAWNRYCVGDSDDVKAAPVALIGIQFGDRIGRTLRPYDSNKQVWLLRDESPRKFLDVPVSEPTFITDNGRVSGAQATAKGKGAYESLRQKMFNAYGIPTSYGGANQRKMSWHWRQARILVRLSYNADHDQTTISLDHGSKILSR